VWLGNSGELPHTGLFWRADKTVPISDRAPSSQHRDLAREVFFTPEEIAFIPCNTVSSFSNDVIAQRLKKIFAPGQYKPNASKM
jgi:hypothetical protein